MIDANTNRVSKELVSFGPNRHGPLANVSLLSTEQEEIAFVCSRVRDLIRRGVSPNDIALLCRMRSGVLNLFTQKLKDMGVPVVTGQIRKQMLEVSLIHIY